MLSLSIDNQSDNDTDQIRSWAKQSKHEKIKLKFDKINGFSWKCISHFILSTVLATKLTFTNCFS